MVLYKLNIKKLPPIRIIYMISLAALGLMLFFTFFMPIATGKEYSTVQKEQVIKTHKGWLVQFELTNWDEESQLFIINELLDSGESYNTSVTIPGGGSYVFTHHILQKDVTGGKVYYQIYRSSEAAPVEKLTYHLK